jgi:RNA recognition motif-containing protein
MFIGIVKLQITNIARNLSDEDFERLFAKYGPLQECVLVKDSQSGQSKGFGFVTLKDKDSAKKATEQLNGRLVNGQKIKVKLLE